VDLYVDVNLIVVEFGYKGLDSGMCCFIDFYMHIVFMCCIVLNVVGLYLFYRCISFSLSGYRSY